MKTIVIASAACLLAATSSLSSRAADADAPRTRAEVIAELNEARASGWLTAHVGEDSGSAYLSRQLGVSQRSRAQVQAELKAARADGSYAAMNTEVGSEPPAAVPAPAPQRYAGPSVGHTLDGGGMHDIIAAHQA